MDCKHNREGVCMIATQLADEECRVSKPACEACSQAEDPQDINSVTAGIALARQRKSGKKTDEDLRMLAFSDAKEKLASGPGTELAALLSWFAKPRQGCACKSRAAVMNRWGVPGCERKREVILKWLEEEMQLRGLPTNTLTRMALATILSLALRRSTDKQPATDEEVHALATVREQFDAGSNHPTPSEQYRQAIADWPFVWTYWENGAVGNELRYSIRSVLHHHPDANVCIVGDRPDWYDGPFIEKPRIPRTSFQAFKDCYSKLHLASETYARFIWMMDDIYWIRPFSINEAIQPKYVRHVWPQRFYDWKPGNAWAKTRAKAYQWLLENNRPTYDYASHLPQPIVAESLQEMERELRLSENYRNFECIYLNCYHSAAGRDWGRRTCRIVAKSKRIDETKPILNHIHSRYEGLVEDYLKEKFADKCKVER